MYKWEGASCMLCPAIQYVAEGAEGSLEDVGPRVCEAHVVREARLVCRLLE